MSRRRRGPRRGRTQGEGGFATVEFALALPAVVMVLMAILAIVSAGIAGLRAGDSARAGAREAAMGASDQRIRSVIHELAGDNSAFTVTRQGEYAEVTVSVTVLGNWDVFRVVRSARALVEPEP